MRDWMPDQGVAVGTRTRIQHGLGFSADCGTFANPEPVIRNIDLGSPRMAEPDAERVLRRSFERLVAPWRDDLYRYALWLCRDPDLADDVVQETMLRAYRSLDKLEDENAVKSWLLTIARREHARVYERKRLDTRDIDSLSDGEAAWIASTNATDIDDMRAAILRLDADYREPLVLQVLMGFSTNEIAAMMGLRQGAVLTRLHRARKKLIERIGPELDLVE